MEKPLVDTGDSGPSQNSQSVWISILKLFTTAIIHLDISANINYSLPCIPMSLRSCSNQLLLHQHSSLRDSRIA